MAHTKSQKSDWTNLLQEAVMTNERLPTGAGWLTARETESIWGLSRAQACVRRSALILAGKLERFCRNHMCGKTLVKATWYRIKK